MKKTYHLSVAMYIYYTFITVIILQGIVYIPSLIFIGTMSDLYFTIVFIVSVIVTISYYYFHVIKINGKYITFSQKMGWRRVTINVEDLSKLMFRYYYLYKNDTRFGRRGYKFNIKGSKEFIKIISDQYSLKAKYDLLQTVLEYNINIEMNEGMKKELEFLQSRMENE